MELDKKSSEIAPPRVFVVTPYHKESLDKLRRCHESVIQQNVRANITHVMVADGHPRTEIDQWNVEHIRLPREHGDYGNAARAVGALIAQSNGAEFIAFLDADNWYYLDHLECMLNAHRHTGAHVMCAWREFYSPTGQKLPMTELEEESFNHADTSALMLSRPVFDLNRIWSNMPAILSPWGDRIFGAAVRHHNIMRCYTRVRTVAFTTNYNIHYEALGIPAPPDSKKPPEDEMIAYMHSFDGIRELVERLGFWPMPNGRWGS